MDSLVPVVPVVPVIPVVPMIPVVSVVPMIPVLSGGFYGFCASGIASAMLLTIKCYQNKSD